MDALFEIFWQVRLVSWKSELLIALGVEDFGEDFKFGQRKSAHCQCVRGMVDLMCLFTDEQKKQTVYLVRDRNEQRTAFLGESFGSNRLHRADPRPFSYRKSIRST